MAKLIVRNVPKEILLALRSRAIRNNGSIENEHREILRAALLGQRKSFAQLLSEMPNVGNDEDFARLQSDTRV
jgi:antitoxin FitA